MVAHKPNIEIEQAPFLILTLSALLNQVSPSENWLLFDCSREKSDSRLLTLWDLSDAKPKRIKVRVGSEKKGTMKNIKFVVKVNRGGAHAPQYVLRIDRLPIQTTTNRKLALVMGRFTAEDAVKSMQNSHCNPELVSVRVGA